MVESGQTVIYRSRHRKRGFVQEPIIGKVMSISKCGKKVNMKYKTRCDVYKSLTVRIESVEVVQ